MTPSEVLLLLLLLGVDTCLGFCVHRCSRTLVFLLLTSCFEWLVLPSDWFILAWSVYDLFLFDPWPHFQPQHSSELALARVPIVSTAPKGREREVTARRNWSDSSSDRQTRLCPWAAVSEGPRADGQINTWRLSKILRSWRLLTSPLTPLPDQAAFCHCSCWTAWALGSWKQHWGEVR